MSITIPKFNLGGDIVRDAIRNCKLGDMSAITINSITTVLTPTTGKRFVLLGGTISVSADASVLFEDNTAATANFIFRTPLLLAKMPYDFDIGRPYVSQAVDNVLKATGSANCAITGMLYFVEI